jgi:hypothetical protein
MRPVINLTILVSAIAMALLVGAPAGHAYEGPWCARSGGSNDYVENCSMRSFEMCHNEISGTGGGAICSPNPRYHADSARPPARRRYRGR